MNRLESSSSPPAAEKQGFLAAPFRWLVSSGRSHDTDHRIKLMTSAFSSVRLEEWLQHEEFLRKVLRRLLASEADVDDALQQTWTKLLERPSDTPEEPRGWLTRVARNVALGGLRARRRRTEHEARALAGARDDSPDESAARVEALQRVGAAILALEEPYRSVVLLRHEQELDLATIARKLGRSEATVRSQLSRAHEQLRGKLDRDFGCRARWAVLAAPLALPEASAVPLVALAAVLTAGAGFGLWWRGRHAVEPLAPALAAAPMAARPEPALSSPAPSVREPLSAPAPVTQDEPGSESLGSDSATERRLPPAELLDRTFYDDYERATYSFQHGLRDDPELALTRNDWDIEFQRGRFDVRMVTDDNSLVADLGALEPLALDRVMLADHEPGERAQVVQGHVYFLWSIDSDTDLACLVVVREHDVGKRCLLDWYATDGSGRAQGSLADDGVGEPLVASLARLRNEARKDQGQLARPEALLQARMGSGGGNENRVHLSGQLERIDRRESTPLDLTSEIAQSEPARAYLEGGWIPAGLSFVVTAATWSGRALGDSNGRGLFTLVVGGETLVEREGTPDPVVGAWSGAITLSAGKEARTYLGLANSSAGEARLFGHFVAAESGLPWAENAGFLSTVAPEVPVEPALAAPRVVLQLRAGAGGGNPNRIALHGQTSVYVDRLESAPLDFTRPPESSDDSLAYFEGGLVPAGQAFVVTSARWWGTSAGDSNGHGELKLVVANETLVAEVDGEGPNQGVWSGRLVVRPGEESRTYLEIANSSAGDALLTGYFEPLGR